ncbi:MAG: hypothetical protein NW200_03315 [Hyphomonadaceae bacterium]|nr:hypothetical protein [Hyphomonadaceae bacterium]
MHAIILQLQLLLAALGALLPLIPQAGRARIASVFDLVGAALKLGERSADDIDDLAAKLAAIRADVERMATAGDPVTADRLDEAFARVTAASRAFRAALGEGA